MLTANHLLVNAMRFKPRLDNTRLLVACSTVNPHEIIISQVLPAVTERLKSRWQVPNSYSFSCDFYRIISEIPNNNILCQGITFPKEEESMGRRVHRWKRKTAARRLIPCDYAFILNLHDIPLLIDIVLDFSCFHDFSFHKHRFSVPHMWFLRLFHSTIREWLIR